MHGRTIHLQRETVPGTWEDFATTLVPAEPAAAHSVATFTLPHQVTLDKLRVVNLLDLFEIEIRWRDGFLGEESKPEIGQSVAGIAWAGQAELIARRRCPEVHNVPNASSLRGAYAPSPAKHPLWP